MWNSAVLSYFKVELHMIATSEPLSDWYNLFYKDGSSFTRRFVKLSDIYLPPIFLLYDFQIPLSIRPRYNILADLFSKAQLI
jgi:hypothetical protein